MIDTMTPQQVLLKAADLIEERGHCQFELVNEQGQVCARGAILAILNGNPDSYCDYRPTNNLRLAAEALVEDLVNTCSIVAWNNQEGRTQKQVVAAFRKAAR